MPNIYDLAEQFKRRLLRKERKSASEMVRAYGQAWKIIREELARLTDQIQQAQDEGEDISPSWLFQRDRLASLLKQVETQINKFAHYANEKIKREQAAAIEAARSDAEQLMHSALGETPAGVSVSFTRLPVGAVENMAGFLSDGSPLSQILNQLGPEASKAVKDALIEGVALGHGPRKIARAVREHFGGSLNRALKVSRTEVLRAYRETSHQTFKANKDVLDGWIWTASLSGRTCPACIALNGTLHSLDEILDDHINGACVAVPHTKSWAQLGFPGLEDTRPEIESGVDWFARQDEEMQQKILGEKGLSLYKLGKLSLFDFVGRRENSRWGVSIYSKSLSTITTEKLLPSY